MRVFSTILSEHLPLVAIVGIYIVAGYAVQGFFSIEKMMRLKPSYNLLTLAACYFTLIFLNVQVLRKNSPKYLNVRSISGFIVAIALAAPFMSTFSSFKQVIPVLQNFTWDYRFMELDRIAHFGHHPWEMFRFMFHYPEIVRLFDYLYILWFPVLFLMCLWMAWSSRRQLRLQFFITACLAWIILGTVAATIFSSAGPCYYSLVVENQPNPYGPLMAQLMTIHETSPLFAVKNQIGIWEAYQDHVWLPFGGISAMPSLHVAIAVLIAMVGWRVNLWAGILLTVYATAIQIGSFILGWHYAIDGYIAFFLVIIIWKSVGIVMDKIYKVETVQLEENSYQRA